MEGEDTLWQGVFVHLPHRQRKGREDGTSAKAPEAATTKGTNATGKPKTKTKGKGNGRRTTRGKRSAHKHDCEQNVGLSQEVDEEQQGVGSDERDTSGTVQSASSSATHPSARSFPDPFQLLVQLTGDGNGNGVPASSISAFNIANQLVTDKLNSILKETNQAVFRDITDFIAQVTSGPTSAIQRIRSPVKEVPVAVLMSGINVPDHDSLFDAFVQHVKNNASPHVALLKSRNCTGMQGLMKQLIHELFNLDKQTDDGQEQVKVGKLANFDFQMLCAWYSERYQHSPDQPPIVVVVQDFEAFPSKALSDFVTICSRYKQMLPIVLVLGVGSRAAIIHQKLSRRAMGLVNTRQFRSRASVATMHDCVLDILMAPDMRVLLGARPLNELLDMFLFHNLSTLLASKGIKLAQLTHCLKQPSAPFAILTNEEQQQLPNQSIAAVDRATSKASTNSVTASSSSATAAEVTCVSNDEDEESSAPAQKRAKGKRSKGKQSKGTAGAPDRCDRQLADKQDVNVEEIVGQAQHVRRQYQKCCAVALAMYSLGTEMTMTSMNQPLLAWLATILSHKPSQTAAWQDYARLLRVSSTETIASTIETVKSAIQLRIITLTQDTSADQLCDWSEAVSTLQSSVRKLTRLAASLAQEYETLQATKAKKRTAVTSSVASAALGTDEQTPAFAKRSALRSALSSSRTQYETDLKALKSRTLRELEQAVDSLATPLQSCAGAELVCFNGSISDEMQGTARRDMHDWLMDPPLVDSAPSSPSADGDDEGGTGPKKSALEKMPDIAILYHIYAECGKLLNLHDWLMVSYRDFRVHLIDLVSCPRKYPCQMHASIKNWGFPFIFLLSCVARSSPSNLFATMSFCVVCVF
eukprot:m.103240 g.103240  ORF g.103240 m.103240 type:complete len:868 (-) comp13231_c0_seq9:1206-3809(-)